MRVFVISAAVAVGALACLSAEREVPLGHWASAEAAFVAEETPAWLEDSSMNDEASGRGRRHRDEAGAMGTKTQNRFGIEGPQDRRGQLMAREEAHEMAGNAGLLGVRAQAGPPGTAVPDPVATDPTTAVGALMGDPLWGKPGPQVGFGGLGLHGSGRGGGAGGHGTLLGGLPARGVLASTFVGGRGVQTRLSDLLDRGVMVDGEQVRLGAFEDRARLSYPLPQQGAVALHAELERGLLHEGDERVHLQVALTARRGERPRRPRLDVRVLLDASGSMASEGKWDNALAATKALVAELAPDDRFGLIAYSNSAEAVVLPRRRLDRAAIARDIQALRNGGGTNLAAALELLQAHPPRRDAPDDVALVVVISDGLLTEGEADPAALGERVRALFDRRGVITTTIGLGEQFDEELMLTLAREGAGSYHFVRDAGDIAQTLDDELQAHLTSVAQALRLRIELPEGVGLSRVYGSRLLDDGERRIVRQSERITDARLARELGIAQNRRRDEERGLRMHIPNLRHGQQHVVLLELSVPAGIGTEALAKVTLDYKDLTSRGNGRAMVLAGAERVADPGRAAESVRRRVKRTVLAFQAGQALQRAAEALHTTGERSALTVLEDHRQLLEAGAQHFSDRALSRDAELLSRYAQAVRAGWRRFSHGERQALTLAMGYYGDRRMR